MKKILIFLMIVLISFSCVACGGSAANTGDLVIWAGGQWINEDAANLKKFLNFINDNYSEELGFKVKLEIKNSYEIDLDTGLRSNTQPDLLLWDRYMTASYAHDDIFLDLDAIVEEYDIDLEKYNQPALNEMKYNGKVYGIPMDVDVWGLYVNTDIVDRYNEGAADSDKLPYEPETWSDLLDMAEKLSVVKDGEVSRVGLSATDVGQRYATFLASARTMQIGNDGMANFDTPAFNDYLTFIRELKELNIDRHGFNDRVAFTAGNLAMIYGSAYTGNYFKNYFKDGNYVYIPQPKWDRIGSETAGTPEQNSTKGGLLGGFGWVIPKPLDKANRGEDWEARVDMAAKFMKLATTDATLNAKWISFCGSLPANKEAWSLDIVEQDQTLKRISEIADDSQARPSLYYFPILDQQTIVANIVKFSNIGGSFSQKTNAELIEIITTDTNDYISLYTE